MDLIAQLAAEQGVALASRLEVPGDRVEQPCLDRDGSCAAAQL
jgi:hypothetical protein